MNVHELYTVTMSVSRLNNNIWTSLINTNKKEVQMPGVVRADIDKHVGHARPCEPIAPFHQTPYRASKNTKVYVESKLAIVEDDLTACGDPATGKSSKVFIMGRGVHRIGDATGSHDCWVSNSAATGSSKVYAG